MVRQIKEMRERREFWGDEEQERQLEREIDGFKLNYKDGFKLQPKHTGFKKNRKVVILAGKKIGGMW